MTAGPSDDALRARFAGLREVEQELVPQLSAILTGAPASKRRPRAMSVSALTGAVAFAVAILVASAWLWAPQPTAPDAVSLALPGWRTPTDTLLTQGDDPLQPMPWSALPTAVLAHSSTHRSQETP